MGVGIDDFLDLVSQLPEVGRRDAGTHTRFEVGGRTIGYLWEPTRTVGLRQTLAEQAALVLERPEVFEVQFTTAHYGWVVAHLDGVDRPELAELVFEAWRLTAPAELVAQRGERLPT